MIVPRAINRNSVSWDYKETKKTSSLTYGDRLGLEVGKYVGLLSEVTVGFT